MPSAAHPADVLFFHCGRCGTELSVPVAMQGVEGPCPFCSEVIKAPLCPVPVLPQRVYLPPLDRQHDLPDPVSAPVPVPVPVSSPAWDWSMASLPEAVAEDETGLAAHTVPEISTASPAGEVRQSIGQGLLPRQLNPADNGGFQARLAIPPSDEPPDDSWREKHLNERRRLSKARKLDKAAATLMDSSFFRVARIALLVACGGLCAGLVIYLKDRKWVLEVPWKPQTGSRIAHQPEAEGEGRPAGESGPSSEGKRASLPAADPANPFLVEDPSELEGVTRTPAPPVLAPVPEPVSVPVGAAPLEASE